MHSYWNLGGGFCLGNNGCLPLILLVGVPTHNAVAITLINLSLQTAMKAKDKEHLMALRNILSALQKESKEVGSATDRLLPNENCVKVLKKLKKMRQDAIQFYRTAGKFNRAEAEEKELQLIQSYLPTQVDESQVRKWAMEAIKLTKASRPSDMGKVMGEMMKQHKSDMDGKVAQVIVASLLKPHQ